MVVAAIFGFLWIRDATKPFRDEEAPADVEPPPAPRQPAGARAAGPDPGEGEIVRFPRSKFLEATTLGLGGLIGVIVTAPVLGFTILPPVHQAGPSEDRRRRDRGLPREQVRDRDVHARPGAGRGLAAHGVHPQQRLPRREPELHDPLQPLRPSRLPGAAERPAARRRDEDREDGPGDNVVDADPDRSRPRASAARATAASTTPRATAPPARPSARSTATTFAIVNGRLLLGTTYAVSKVDGHRHGREDPQVSARRPGPARRRARGLALPGAAAPLMAKTKQGRLHQLLDLLLYPLNWLEERTRSRATRGSSAGSSTSSSARSRATSAGGTRSARPR